MKNRFLFLMFVCFLWLVSFSPCVFAAGTVSDIFKSEAVQGGSSRLEFTVTADGSGNLGLAAAYLFTDTSGLATAIETVLDATTPPNAAVSVRPYSVHLTPMITALSFAASEYKDYSQFSGGVPIAFQGGLGIAVTSSQTTPNAKIKIIIYYLK
jgi:hypothetical protein